MREKKRALESVPLKNISIVLVEPRGPANIGAAARAMENCGLHDLVLVNPCEYDNDECFGRACNAGEVVLKARLYPTLTECVADFGFIMGTTRRTGKLREPLTDISGAVSMIKSMSQNNDVAILFGREDRGLINTELALCDALVELPAHEGYPSLNLSHAVFLLCHYIYMDSVTSSPLSEIKAAPREERELMYGHMEEMLRAVDYGDDKREFLLRAIIRNFRVLFGRTSLMEKEVAMLRGIFSQILLRLNR